MVAHALHLETLRPSATSSLLELPSLALDVWFLVLVRAKAEMLDRLTRVLRSTQQDNIASSRVSHGQLIDRQALSASLFDPGASCGCEAEGCDVQLWDREHAVVVCDGADDGDGLVGVGLFGGLGRDFSCDAGDGHGWAVDAGHEEAAEDDFVEVGVSATGKEAVELH